MKTTIETAIHALKMGKFVIVVDDESRENEGDLIIAAEKVTIESMAFMTRYTTGIICLPMEGERLDALNLPQMVPVNTDKQQTAFTVSVDSLSKTSSGVSAADRVQTILDLIDPATKPTDLSRPGHIFPLRYKEGGVLKRAGHTEAAVDLMRLAQLYPASAIAELINDDGTMMRFEHVKAFSEAHQIPVISVEDIVRYRRQKEKLIKKISQARLPTEYGEFEAYVYESHLDNIQHIALVKGDLKDSKNTLVRVHSECLTGDIFGSKRCDCGHQLEAAMQMIEQEGKGVIVYLRGQEGRGIGLAHKLRAYQLQDQGCDTVEANEELGFPIDSREYGIGAQILADLGLSSIRLITNNPAKYTGLGGYNLSILERISLSSPSNHENRRYLETKNKKMGHLIDIRD